MFKKGYPRQRGTPFFIEYREREIKIAKGVLGIYDFKTLQKIWDTLG